MITQDITRPMSLPSGQEELVSSLRQLASAEDQLTKSLRSRGSRCMILAAQSAMFASEVREKAKEIESSEPQR
jgi:hypothetical protein